MKPGGAGGPDGGGDGRRAWTLDRAHGRVVAVPVVEAAELIAPPMARWATERPIEPAVAAAIAELHADERAGLAQLAPARRGEWIAGRRALRAALHDVGGADVARVPLAADDRGAPVVPAGLVGSISHKRALAVAVAAADDGWRVGIDLEQVGPRRVDVAPRIMVPAERAAIAALSGAARDLAVIRAFALKEAVYKAIDPFLRRHVGFLEVEVWPDDDGGARVVGDPAWGLDLEAAWCRQGDHLVCTARARLR